MNSQEKLEAMFCPRLDSALVASIYHDIRDFKACIPILSELAAATGSPTNTTAGAKSPEISSKNAPGMTTTTAKMGNKSLTGEGSSSLASLSSKKIPTAPTKDKNILIWSEQVASSRSDNSSSPLGYKQGQVTNSSSYRVPTASSASATPTTASAGIAATTASTKTAFRALRNPNFVRNNGLPPGMEMPTMPGAFPEHTIDEYIEDEQEEQEQNEIIEDFVAAELQQEQPLTKKKKNRRPKRSGKATQQQAAVPSPSLQASPRRTWQKSAEGHYAFEEKILDQFAALDLDTMQTLPGPGGNTDNNDDDFESEETGTDEVSSIYSQKTSSSANDISTEELEFLKSCFPDRQHSDEFLAQVFRDSRRDVEAAVELILSRMFLENEQVETSSSGSSSLYSNGSQATSATTGTTGSLDDAFFQGVQKSNKKIKGWNGQDLAWGGVGVKPKTPSLNIPGLTDRNDPLLNAIDRQDGFLLPESNEWTTFDHQISILMNIFHTVPKKTIVSAYHANGTQLFKTVEYLENQLKKENYGGSAEGQQRHRQFDINLAQLMEIFPDQSAHGLKKMLVLQGGNVQEAMNAVLALDLAQSDHDLQNQQQQRNGKRTVAIPLQADIRYADKTVTAATTMKAATTRLKTLPSTNNPYPGGQRPFPNTLLDKSNAELYNDDDDPIWCRQRAHEVLEQRNELFRKAAKAYQSTKGKGVGMGGIAAYYADEGKKLDVQGKQWHMRAARAVVHQHRVENNDPNLVDLHGLTIAEAQTVVREAVTQWFSRSTMQASRIAGKPLKIICGVGSHSKDRIARLYPTILNLLMKDGWRCEAENGVIFVKGVSRIMPGNKK